MASPELCKTPRISNDIYIEPLISENFKYAEFFEKCKHLDLIKTEHITKHFTNISTISNTTWKFISAIAGHVNYTNLTPIARYIEENRATVCFASHLHVIFLTYKKIHRNSKHPTTQHENDKKMNDFLLYNLCRMNFRYDVISNAFSLLKTLSSRARLEEDSQRLQFEYDKKLEESLRYGGNFLPFYYYANLVLFTQQLPSEENLNALLIFSEMCSQESGASAENSFDPKLWIGSLLLITNISLIKQELIENTLKILHKALHSSITAVKLAAINMIFDVCNIVTHNFEEIVNFMFRQLVTDDNAFKRNCLTKIDRLLRDEYLKLDLHQFIVLMCVLGEKNYGLGDHLNELLSDSFFARNIGIVAKYFVPFIIHINGYRNHPDHRLENNSLESIGFIARKVSNKTKIYDILLKELPFKSKISVVHTLSVHILDNVLKGKLDHCEGYREMVNDSLYIFKAISVRDSDENLDTLKRRLGEKIAKYLLRKTEYPERPIYISNIREIVKCTDTLFKSLYLNETSTLRNNTKSIVFDALIYWSDFFMSELVHTIHTDGNKTILKHYTQMQTFLNKLYK